MTKERPISVLIVDDHNVLRAGLALFLKGYPEVDVVGEAGTKAEAVSETAKHRPDIVLLDLDLGDDDGIDCMNELLNVSQRSRVIVLTGIRDTKVQLRAVEAGAMGILHKETKPDVIVNAIREVHKGSAWLDRTMMGSLLAGRAPAKSTPTPEDLKIKTLTSREREVVELIGRGLRSREIAEKLFITETTVRHHLTSIFGKLEVADRVELMLFAYRHGLAKPPAGD